MDKEALRISQEVLRQQPDSQPVVDLVIALKTASHWTMVPLRPIQKWGWGGSIGIWFVVVLLLRGLRDTPYEAVTTPIALVFLAYVLYSWIWPPILKRWMAR